MADENSTKLLWTVVWLLILLCFGWWLGYVCAFIYVFLLPFSACIPALTEFTEMFLKGAKIPFYMAKMLIEGTPAGEAKFSD